MTTIDPRNSDAELGRRLVAWKADQPVTFELTEIYDAVVLSTRTAPQRPRLLVARNNGRAMQAPERAFREGRVAVAILTAVVTALAIGLGIFIGSRLLDRVQVRPTLPGVFRITGNIPAEAGYLIRPAVAVLQDGRVLVAGGEQENPMALIYSPATGTYGPPIPMPSLRQGATGTTLADGRVLVAGGSDGTTGKVFSSALLYDPATDTFIETGDMSVPRDYHTATLLPDGRVLVVGGRGVVGTIDPNQVTSTTASADIYDPATGTFSPTGSLATGRAGQTATVLPDGRTLIAGGYTVSMDGRLSMATTAEMFDPPSGSFHTVGTLTTPRAQHSASLLQDGRVLIVGGGLPDNMYGYLGGAMSSAELFDPRAGTFTPTGSLTTERYGHAATLMPDGRVLITGGANGFGGPRTAEVFDPTGGVFELGPTAAAGHPIDVAPLLADGQVFLPGLEASDGGFAELFDPRGAIAGAPATATPGPTDGGPFRPITTTMLRSEHTATRLLDGRVLIAGGMGGRDNGVLATAEIFDPATDTSSATGSMAVPRVSHVATLLPDGQVLVAGGGDDLTIHAEVYDPVAGTFSPASPEIQNVFADHQVFPIRSLSDGHLMVADQRGDSMRSLDAATGRLGPSTPSCYFAQGAVEMRDGRILVPCHRGRSALIVDPVTGTNTPAPAAVDFDGALTLDDGRILLEAYRGGETDAVYLVLDGVFDPATGTITPTAPAGSTPPKAGELVQLDSGLVLMAGGTDGNLSDLAQILDPTTLRSGAIAPLVTPRRDPTMTRLLDGRVLIVGGAEQSADRTDPVPPGAEIFDPRRLP